MVHDGSGKCGGIKNELDEWDLAGHRNRVINVDEDLLALFARLYDEPGTAPLEARLPSLHARELADVLRKLAAYPERLGDLDQKVYASTQMWYETPAVMDGTICRATSFPQSGREWIVSGPHIHIANPYFKTPRAISRQKGDYDPLDLTVLPAAYLPRTNYIPACDSETYVSRTLHVPWGAGRPVTDFYRLFMRRALSQSGERTLLATTMPPGPGHIDGCFSLVFESYDKLLSLAASCASLPTDFLIKTTGKGDIRIGLAILFPVLPQSPSLALRTILLSCLTIYWADLWKICWQPSFVAQRWTKNDPRLTNDRFACLTPEWRWETPLRAEYERRQALVEVDVLAARALGLTIDELCTMYRIQFPVLRQNERDTWYDRYGRIVFTCSKGLPGVGVSRPEWEKIKAMTSGVVTRTIEDDTLPSGPRERVIEYVAPFDRCDREADYATAWKFFDEAGV